jgi:hypothetical protein
LFLLDLSELVLEVHEEILNPLVQALELFLVGEQLADLGEQRSQLFLHGHYSYQRTGPVVVSHAHFVFGSPAGRNDSRRGGQRGLGAASREEPVGAANCHHLRHALALVGHWLGGSVAG